MKLRLLFISVVLISVLAISLLFSRQVYSFYMYGYYTMIKGMNRNEMITYTASLMKEGSDTEKLKRYAEHLELLYSGDTEAARVAGLAWLTLDDSDRATPLLVSSMDQGMLPVDQMVQVARVLYEQEYYSDLEMILSEYAEEKGLSGDLKNLYGLSLFHQKKYIDACKYLREIWRPLHSGAETGLATGVSCRESGDYDMAEKALQLVLRGDPTNDRAVRELVKLYREAGRYDDAETVMRRLRR